MKNLLCDSKLNMKIIIFLILIGLNIGLYFNFSFLINHTLDYFTHKAFDTYTYYYILIFGALLGMLVSSLIPESKNKISEFSGVSNKLFNYIDYFISIFTGFFIGFSFYIIIAIAYYLSAKYFTSTNYHFIYLKSLVFMFGFLNGGFCKILVDNKIFELENEFTKIQKVYILIIFMLFYYCIGEFCASHIFWSLNYIGTHMFKFFNYLNLSQYLEGYKYYLYMLPF